MAKANATSAPKPRGKMRPALSQENRENQMISLAEDLAEEQLRNGTASSQVITHYLRLGTTLAKLEKAKLEEENKLLRAKTKALEDQKEIKVLYADALKAMRRYSGQEEVDEEDDYYED